MESGTTPDGGSAECATCAPNSAADSGRVERATATEAPSTAKTTTAEASGMTSAATEAAAAVATTTATEAAAAASRCGDVGRSYRNGCHRQQGDHRFAQHD